ncbi:MAG TPA: hypothetical protein GX497_02880 [Bacillus bacterium]|nr:hypothetical protein [Bacillus sp. (in: firmicutes)]
MRNNIFLSILSIMIVTIMSACTQDNSNDLTENDKVTTTSQNNETYTMGLSTDDQERIARMEKGILLYGESTKGGYFSTRVHSAYLEETNPSSIVVNVTIKNVRGEQIDISELKYHLNDEKSKKSYNGKVLTDKIPSETIILANESRELNISFDVPEITDEYMFSVESSLDPVDIRWKIDNLK